MDVKISPKWKEWIGREFDKPYFGQLVEFVKQEYAQRRVFPPGRNIFRAFDMCDPDNLKVVIIGQDPYHGPGQANGLCFSVGDGVPFPPSLVNIFKEVHDDTGAPVPASGNLDRWAEQGVLLLNAVLTVRAHEAASHAGHGWERFTDEVVKAIALRKQGGRLHAMGLVCAAQGFGCRSAAQLHSQGGPPVAPVGLSGIFRLPPFQPRERVPAKHRPGADPMVRMRGGEKLCVCRAHFAGARVARR